MPLSTTLGICALLAATGVALAGPERPAHEPPDDAALRRELGAIRSEITQRFGDSASRPDYPLADAFRLLPRREPMPFLAAATDTTPPADPSALVISTQSVHSLSARWSPALDPESGIAYYAYAIGTAPGGADLRWWQSVGNQTSSYPTSLLELGVAEGTEVYVSVYAVNGAGLFSHTITGGPAALVWEDLGLPSATLTVGFADYGFDAEGNPTDSGWGPAERQELEHFTARMVPIIREIYGPPSHTYEVRLVKNLFYAGSNVFFPGSDEIHMAVFYPQLLTHELIHAYRDNVILSADEFWRYHPRLSGFEEGCAQGVSYICMNRYIEMYPDDPAIRPTWLFGSSMDWDYDFQNTDAITTENFWSDAGGLGIFWTRYELAAAAMRKIHLEDPAVFSRFNAEYYARLNADHSLRNSRAMMIDLIAGVVPEIEGLPAADWVERQRIFDCRIVPGRKIWVRTQHYPWQEYIIFQSIHYYETFRNGSDWAYWDDDTQRWIYHRLNGSTGTGTVTTSAGAVVWNGGLLIEPVGNPPVVNQFGWDRLSLSTDDDLEPWPGGDPADYLLGAHAFQLYRVDVSFDTTHVQVPRVIGDALRGPRGVFGGMLHATRGLLYLDHEDAPPEPPLEVRDGAFWGPRQWASVANPRTGGCDSRPGRVRIRFIDPDGNQRVAQRNIDWGSWSGNQLFLLDVEAMTPDSGPGGLSASAPAHLRLAVHPNRPNPFNPTTEIRYALGEAAPVRVLIYDAGGRQIKQLVADWQTPGEHAVRWDATGATGAPVASGIYFYVVDVGDARVGERMMLLR